MEYPDTLPLIRLRKDILLFCLQAQDPTKRVLIILSVLNVKDPSFVAVNLAGDALYNSTNVIKLQRPVDAEEYVSFGNVVRLFYQGSKNVGGYKIRYMQVD